MCVFPDQGVLEKLLRGTLQKAFGILIILGTKYVDVSLLDNYKKADNIFNGIIIIFLPVMIKK